MNCEIVVSRFKEDVSWTSTLRGLGFKVTVYNKHEGDNLLKNVGRESHTYLTHIIRNWDSLSDVTIFVQGNPFEHSTNFLQQILLCQNQNFDFRPIYQFQNGCVEMIVVDRNSQPGGFIDNKFIPVGLHFEWLTLKESPQVFIATPGAQFAVSKECLKKYSKYFYERAIKSLEYDVNPIEGHCFERSWAAIFDANKKFGIDILDYEKNESNFKEIGITAKDYESKFIKDSCVSFLGELNSSYRNF